MENGEFLSIVSHRLAVCLRHTGLYPGVDPQLVGAVPLGVKKNGLKLHTYLCFKTDNSSFFNAIYMVTEQHCFLLLC